MAGCQSCTYVGTEYEHPFSEQTKEFTAKVEYFAIEAIRALLERLLQEYYTWVFEKQTEWTEDDKQEHKRLSKTALSTFCALFCDQTEFESSGAGAEFLHSAYDDGEQDDVLDTLVGWCEDLLEEKNADEADHNEYLDADSQKKLLEQLEPLVSSTPCNNKTTFWPLVRKVR